MSDTGSSPNFTMSLRRRFILTTTFIILLTVFLVSFFQYKFIENEKIHLVDRSIEASMALILLSDPLQKETIENLEEVDTIISEVLGEEKLSQFLILSNNLGEPIYKSHRINQINLKINPSHKWQTIRYNDNLIRVLTLQSENKIYSLSLGQILTSEELNWESEKRLYVWIFFFTIVIGFFSAFLITHLNLSPLRKLSAYLQHVAFKDSSQNENANLHILIRHDDELGKLAQSIHAARIYWAHQRDQQTSLLNQMAHELKTPLTVLTNRIYELENALKQEHLEDALTVNKYLNSLKNEQQQLNLLVSTFLEWSQSQSNPFLNEEIYALNANDCILEVLEQFDFSNRLRIVYKNETTENFRLFSNKSLFQQLIKNLISNSLKYSTDQVLIELQNKSLTVFDKGPGVPHVVQERLGQPFNRGNAEQHGHGLGLAWVYTICQKYGWRMNFSSNKTSKDSYVQIYFTDV